MYIFIGVRGIPYGYIFSWVRGMGVGRWEIIPSLSSPSPPPPGVYSENIINNIWEYNNPDSVKNYPSRYIGLKFGHCTLSFMIGVVTTPSIPILREFEDTWIAFHLIEMDGSITNTEKSDFKFEIPENHSKN